MYAQYPNMYPQNGNYYARYQDRLDSMQGVSGQRYEIIHVNGENGARAFRMAPNSQCLLLDDTAPLVWLCQSDGASYHTVIPYEIKPYKQETPPDTKSLEERISRLEEIINVKSDVTNAVEGNSASSAT